MLARQWIEDALARATGEHDDPIPDLERTVARVRQAWNRNEPPHGRAV